jgi:CHAD domain-containing protein
MAFRLKAEKSVGKGVKRVVRCQLDKALARLRSKGGGDEAVHDARKSFKKVRAVLRLVRDEIGGKCYRRENRRFRDAARPLTEVRDAKALVEAVDRLAEQSPDGADDALLADVRKAIQADRRAVRRRVLRDKQAIPAVVSEVKAARDRLPSWSMPHNGWSALAGGIKRTYKGGRQALAAAGDDPTPEALHEWRKQAKYLWHQLQLLEPVWPGVVGELAHEVEALAEMLGDDHDLVVLRARLTAAPEEFGSQHRLEAFLALIDRRRGELAEEAFALGRRLYADGPKEFTSRLREYWKAWRANPDAALHA